MVIVTDSVLAEVPSKTSQPIGYKHPARRGNVVSITRDRSSIFSYIDRVSNGKARSMFELSVVTAGNGSGHK